MHYHIIGDVHGMLDTLKLLIQKLDVKSIDHVVFVGDLLDKGPDSPGVVEYARNLINNCNVTLVEGNHEEKHGRYRRHIAANRVAIATQMADNMPELSTITEQLSSKDITFLNSAVPFYRVPNTDIIVLHGGIPQNMFKFPATVEEASLFTGARKSSFNRILRTRYVDAETGDMIKLGKQIKGDPFWAEVYDGRFGHVVFGHEPFLNEEGGIVSHYKYATGIDTGAVLGGGLTGMTIHEDGSHHFLTIPSPKMAERRSH